MNRLELPALGDESDMSRNSLCELQRIGIFCSSQVVLSRSINCLFCLCCQFMSFGGNGGHDFMTY